MKKDKILVMTTISQTNKRLRTVRSFARRGGRISPSQKQAIDALWSQFCLPKKQGLIDFSQVFGRRAPIVLEIGFGNGESLANMAAKQPENNFLGAEVYLSGIGSLLKKIDTLGLTNVRIANIDAVELLSHHIADQTLDRLNIYFPDPWHKKRHHKRRIIQPPFVALIARKLKAGGYVHIATDWQHYAEQILAVLSCDHHFVNCSKTADYIARPNERPLTKFERRGHKLGHQVYDLLFKHC